MIDPHAAIGCCCGEAWTPATARLSRSGPHWRASCPRCGRYLKFLPQRASDFHLWFGKHKSQRVADVWRTDPAYCEWLLQQPWLTPRLREVLEETRPAEVTE